MPDVRYQLVQTQKHFNAPFILFAWKLSNINQGYPIECAHLHNLESKGQMFEV